MPWVSRRDYDYLMHTIGVLEKQNRRLARSVDDRTEQVRELRRSIHRLRSEVGAAVNIAVRQAHAVKQVKADPAAAAENGERPGA